MKKIALFCISVALVSGALFSQYWYYLPGIISDIVAPIGDNRRVSWKQGPERPSHGVQDSPPNVVLIVADDLGFNDITFYGGGLADGTVPTPHIDSIAQDGMHFTNGYSGNGTCAPSRAALLTGRYPSRVGFEFTPASPTFSKLTAGDAFIEENTEHYPAAEDIGLPTDELTLPELLKQRGYYSIGLGKWHLGGGEGSRPLDQGFDEFLGFRSGAGLFMNEDDEQVVNSKQDFDPIDKFLWANLKYAVRFNGGERFAPDSHMTDYISRQAVEAIKANRNRPFFMYLAYNAPHTPLQAEKDDYDALSHIPNHTERVYAGMIRGLDRGIGQVINALKDNGIDDNTIVIFTSDNGGAGYVGLPDLNKPYRGWKITFFEGGIHTPYFIKWPKKISPGSAYDSAVAHIDIFSTTLAAAGIELPRDRTIDGKNILEYALQTDQPRIERSLFWRTGGYKVVQRDGWKLQIQEQNGNTWLFNLNEDPTEQNNLSSSQPQQLNDLKTALYKIDQQMIEPLWPNLVEIPIAVDYTFNARPQEDHETIIWAN